jgi:CelD/BcsL family acetyltransferase involved in cellulose biosynthesis
VNLHVCTSVNDVAGEWRAFQETALHTPFQDVDWVLNWMSVADPDVEPVVVLGYEDGNLQFILPLCATEQLGVRQLCWLAQDINDYNAPLVEALFAQHLSPAMAADIWKHVGKTAAADSFRFSKMPSHLDGVQNCFIPQGAVPGSCSSHMLSLPDNWREFYSTWRTTQSRRRVRAKTRKLAEAGRLSFRSERNVVRRRALVRTVISWKSRQLSNSGDRNPFQTAPNGDESELEKCLLRLASCEESFNKLRLDALYVGDEPVAISIAFVDRSCYSLFVMAYCDGDLARFSPGKLLLMKTIELASRAGLKTFDFLAGDEDYKLSLCDQRVLLLDHVSGLSAKGHCAATVIASLRRAKSAIKHNPQIMNVLRSINRARLALR